MLCSYRSFDLQLKDVFTISRESYDIQPTVIVKLEWDGFYGLGECTTNPFYHVTASYLGEKLAKAAILLKDYQFTDPEKLHIDMTAFLPDDPFVVCAIDLAAWDLYAKMKNLPLYQVWGLQWDNIPLTNFTIGIDTIDVMVHKMKEKPWPIYKIKLGTDRDLDIIKALRQHTSSVFRIDANCAWDAATTIAYSGPLKELGVEFIEQPVGAYDYEEAERAYLGSLLPIIADESCQVEGDVARCKDRFHGINIKLVKCGGLTPALRMIRQARLFGMSVMVGCMTESSVGISAIAHLLPLLDYVDMDGAMLLKEDIARGVIIENGVCHQPFSPGTGIEMVVPL
ncbi:MAG TPA: dipeptide epimerase [Saprospiraceae bacterium]|nr:dipeptide epimerase [Saprospiraceae bacterium]